MSKKTSGTSSTTTTVDDILEAMEQWKLDERGGEEGYDSAAERIVAEIRNGADTVGEHVIEEFVAELSQPDSLLASALIERLVPKLAPTVKEAVEAVGAKIVEAVEDKMEAQYMNHGRANDLEDVDDGLGRGRKRKNEGVDQRARNKSAKSLRESVENYNEEDDPDGFRPAGIDFIHTQADLWVTVFGNRRSQHSKALISPLKNLLFENNEIISETEALKIIIETDIIVPADERGGGFASERQWTTVLDEPKRTTFLKAACENERIRKQLATTIGNALGDVVEAFANELCPLLLGGTTKTAIQNLLKECKYDEINRHMAKLNAYGQGGTPVKWLASFGPSPTAKIKEAKEFASLNLLPIGLSGFCARRAGEATFFFLEGDGRVAPPRRRDDEADGDETPGPAGTARPHFLLELITKLENQNWQTGSTRGFTLNRLVFVTYFALQVLKVEKYKGHEKHKDKCNYFRGMPKAQGGRNIYEPQMNQLRMLMRDSRFCPTNNAALKAVQPAVAAAAAEP